MQIETVDQWEVSETYFRSIQRRERVEGVLVARLGKFGSMAVCFSTTIFLYHVVSHRPQGIIQL